MTEHTEHLDTPLDRSPNATPHPTIAARREAQLDRFRMAMKRYATHKDFGREGRPKPGKTKGTPYHVNTKQHPRPCIRTAANGRKFQVEARLTRREDQGHFSGGPALFHKARSDRKTALYAVDVDGDSGVDWQVSAAYGREALRRLFPRLKTFDEPGRSWPHTGGAYSWLRVAWGRTPQPIIRLYELMLIRQLQKLAPPAPAGVEKLDEIKGRMTYKTRNPLFDAAYAAEPSGRRRKVDAVRVPPRQAAKMIWGRTAIPLQDAVIEFENDDSAWVEVKALQKALEDLPNLLDGLTLDDLEREHRYRELTREEAYEQSKAFYMIDYETGEVDRSARFEHDPRLERHVRHMGVLVTRPCRNAWTAERENNIDAFCDWTDNPAGQITLKDVQAALPDSWVAYAKAQERRLRQDDAYQVRPLPWHRLDPGDASKALAAEPQKPKAKKAQASQPREPRPITSDHELPAPAKGIDWLLLTTATPFASKQAASRIAVRFHHGDAVAATPTSVALYEQYGPVTGDAEVDRMERLDDHGRFCEYWAALFDRELCGNGTGSAFAVDPEDVAWMMDHLHACLPAYLIRFANEGHSRAALDLETLATVLVIVQLAMHDDVGELGAAPTKLIRRAAQRYLDRHVHRHTIAAAVWAFREAGLLTITRKHAPSQCRLLQLSVTCPLLPQIAALPADRRCVARRRPPAPRPHDNVGSSHPGLPLGDKEVEELMAAYERSVEAEVRQFGVIDGMFISWTSPKRRQAA